MPNRLANETSPYLLQHANNPVEWYPWGEEALTRAQEEDKPILLSVGYSACHWCHVMERESFENPEIAQMMNDNFINIKVDREERPDIDSIYMTAVQAIAGHGGWPMTVFLTPQGKPFYGGTYFPPEERGGMPSFPRVLDVMSTSYRDKRADIVRSTEQITQYMQQASSVGSQGVEPLTDSIMYQAFREISQAFDDRHGGVGIQPKFPQPMTYEFLLRYYMRSEAPDALEMVELTLERMAKGGIYDQIGGGFHRYSTDAYWLVPHFEKMLYDNALLVKLYIHAYQVTGKPLYKRIVEETLDYVLREMTSPQGGFYSAQDADSEGVEGKFFIWLPQEITEILGDEDGEVFIRYFGVVPQGNFEGRNILHMVVDHADYANELGISEDELSQRIERAKAKMLEVRNGRIAPGLDDKILTSWNGLMLRAFAEAGAVLNRKDYIEVAERNAAFLLDNLVQDGRLLRTYKSDDGEEGRAKLNGYLEDYAFLIDGLLALHEATFGTRWLKSAIELGEAMVELFWDEASGFFYDTGSDHEELVIRPRDVADNAIPSGSSMATDVLLRLAVITGNSDMETKAATSLRSAREMMTRFPTGAGHWLSALDFYLSSAKEIVIVGPKDSEDTDMLVSEVHRHYLPNRVFLGIDAESELGELPLLEAREQIGGRPTAYVCQNYVCQLPVTTAEDLAKQLVD